MTSRRSRFLTPQFAAFLGISVLAFVVASVAVKSWGLRPDYAFAAGAVFALAMEPVRDFFIDIQQEVSES